jgi:nitrite reductase/ring-hydroxylating ferredoxin subunit
MTNTQWVRVMDAAQLGADKPRTIKTHGKQIALFRAGAGDGDGDGDIQAIDNRCPHEGYPLSTGMLKDGVLTCEWHNWKFRLCDGVCLLGGEDVRHYPLRVEDGGIWLDLGDPPASAATPGMYASLEHAFAEGDWGHAGRTIERLLEAGEQPGALLGFGCDWAARHAPYGFDHGLAAAADIAAMVPLFEGEPGIPLLEALNLMVEPNLRRPPRQWPEPEPVLVPVDGSADWKLIEVELRRRIEAEDLAGAEALLRGALAAGAGPDQVFAWLTHAATDHFLGYGHSHIFCVKAEELLQAIGWDHAHPVLTSLVSQIVYETREDRLPYMREFGTLMAGYTGRLDAWARPGASAARPGAGEIVTAVVDGDLGQALGAVAAALDRGVAADRIALALALAAAHRLMRFDPRLEHDDDISEGWLHITHALTHADAVRESLLRRPSRDALRGLFHSARFVQHMAVCDLPAGEQPAERSVEPVEPVEHAGAPAPDAADLGLGRALVDRDAAGAMAAARLGLQRGSPVREILIRAALSDRAALPIFVVHHVKTTMAALRLSDAMTADPELREHADMPVIATLRFLAHPLQERRVARRARISRVFVREGRMQTKLLGY